MRYLRSVGAVVAGFVAVTVLSLGTDIALAGLGAFALDQAQYPAWVLLLSVVYGCAYAAIGGALTARLAPSNPLAHARALAVLGLLSSVMGAAANWGTVPHWYCISLVVLTPIAVLAGATAVSRRAR